MTAVSLKKTPDGQKQPKIGPIRRIFTNKYKIGGTYLEPSDTLTGKTKKLSKT